MGKTGKPYFVRLRTAERVVHIIFVTCFAILIITGYLGEVPDEMAGMLGTAGAKIFYLRGILHRVAAVVLIITLIYLIQYMIFRPKYRRRFTNLMPKPDDFSNVVANHLYYFDITNDPQWSRKVTYKNKFLHTTLTIVTIIMIVTGIILWTEQRWSKFTFDVSSLLHSLQAIMLCLAITISYMFKHFLIFIQKYLD